MGVVILQARDQIVTDPPGYPLGIGLKPGRSFQYADVEGSANLARQGIKNAATNIGSLTGSK
jgi:hypothetical protein